jgi:methanogenic corrinoid protein MtbC1
LIRWCAYCQRYLGEAEPYDDYSMTHGMCEACVASGVFESSAGEDGMRRLAQFHRRLQESARTGLITTASELLDQGISMGLRPIDLLMGLIQPALYHVGELWSSGAVTVSQEHRLTSVAATLLALVTSKYPERATARQASRPKALLLNAAGNYHTLGLQFVDLVLMLNRVPAFTVFPGIEPEEVVGLWGELEPDVIGFSVAIPTQLDAVRRAVELLREAGARPRVVVGGYPIRLGAKLHPELGIEVVTDAVAFGAELAGSDG